MHHQPASGLSLIYITAKDRAQALALGRGLVESRLAACANVIGGMTSIYHWEGNIEEAEEVVLIAKTTTAKVEELTGWVRAHHTYSVPCVLELPVKGGNPDYLTWLRAAVAP